MKYVLILALCFGFAATAQNKANQPTQLTVATQLQETAPAGPTIVPVLNERAERPALGNFTSSAETQALLAPTLLGVLGLVVFVITAATRHAGAPRH